MSTPAESQLIRNAVNEEMGWQPLREVPPVFTAAVDIAEAAVLRFARQDDPAAALDVAVREWDSICGHRNFEDSPLLFRLDALNRCGIAHLDRYARNGQEPDYQAAHASWEHASALAPADWPEQARFLHNQGMLSWSRYKRQGQVADLEVAIPLLQAAVNHPNPGAYIDMFLSSLGQTLDERYLLHGTLTDLESAIVYGERSLISAASQRRGLILELLGNWYRQRFERTGRDSDIQRAVALLEESVVDTSHASLPFRLTNLGNALLSRHGLAGTRADVDRAVEAQRKAVSLTPLGEKENLTIRLNNLANSLSKLFSVSGDGRLLDEAVDTYRRVVDNTEPYDPLRPSRFYNLGLALLQRFDAKRSPPDAQAATDAFREACLTGLEYSLEWALGAANAWGSWAEQLRNWAEAAEAYGYGLRAIDSLYQMQLLAESQASWLREARDLAARAAYVQARTGQYRAGGGRARARPRPRPQRCAN